jgi:hypothetical protein
LLQRLHDNGWDKVGNRRHFFDQSAALLLRYLFNPILTSLNALERRLARAAATRVSGLQWDWCTQEAGQTW